MKTLAAARRLPSALSLLALLSLCSCTGTTIFKDDYQTGETVGARFQGSPPYPPDGDEVLQSEGTAVIVARMGGHKAVEMRATADQAHANLWHVSAPTHVEAGEKIVATWSGEWPAANAPARLSANLVANPGEISLGRLEFQEGRVRLFGDDTGLVARDVGEFAAGSHTVILSADPGTGMVSVFFQQAERRPISGEVPFTNAARLAGSTDIQLGMILQPPAGQPATYLVDDALIVRAR